MASGVTAATLGFYLLGTALYVAASEFWPKHANWPLRAVGAGRAVGAARRRGALGRVRLGPVALPLLAAVGGHRDGGGLRPGAGALHVYIATSGRSYSFVSANAFRNPAAVIVGRVVIMAALVLAPVAATLLYFRSAQESPVARLIVPQAANPTSGAVQLLSPVAPATVGVTVQEMAAAKSVLSVGATGWFWAEAMAVGLPMLLFLVRILGLPGET